MATENPSAQTYSMTPTIERRFQELATAWKRDSEFLSSTTEIATVPEYQKIIGMGPVVLPLILRELEREPRQWFWALAAITGVNPVPEAHRGRVQEMAADWLQWAAEQGYEW